MLKPVYLIKRYVEPPDDSNDIVQWWTGIDGSWCCSRKAARIYNTHLEAEDALSRVMEAGATISIVTEWVKS